jgi:hypothetical protein
MNDILSIISVFSDRKDLLYLFSVSKLFKFFDQIFFNKYFVDQEKTKNCATEFISKIRLINNVYTIDKLPQSLKSIKFGYHFNQSVDKLPQSITSIQFGEHFNQSVDKLPQSITSIQFGSYFNQSVDNLPQSATYRMY